MGTTAKTERVLVVRVDGLGDFVLWLHAAKALRRIFPASGFRLTLVCDVVCQEVALASQLFDEVWPVERPRLLDNLAYRWRCLRRIRKGGFSTAISPGLWRDPLCGDALVRAANAKVSVGADSTGSNSQPLQTAISNRWYSRLVKPEPQDTHELLWQKTLLRTLGDQDYEPDASLVMPGLPCLPEALTSGAFFVVFPAAAWHGRRWPVSRFAEIAARIQQCTGLTCVLCGGQKDVGLSNTFGDHFGSGFIDLVGKTTLPELSGILKAAELVISNETSAVHIAAAAGTPSICILGGGHFGKFIPYPSIPKAQLSPPMSVFSRMDCFGCDWNCIYPLQAHAPTPCVDRISTADVWSAIEPLIKEIARQHKPHGYKGERLTLR